MEVIEQEPIAEPERGNNGIIWKILTCVFAVTTIIAGFIALTSGSKETKSENNSSSNNSSSSSKSSASTPSSSNSGTQTTDELALKNFDINIGGLVGAAGFGSGSILTLKTNSDGTYMFGEVKANGQFGYAYRALPNGSWQKSPLNETGSNVICEETKKDILEIFEGISFSGAGTELKCTHLGETSSTTSKPSEIPVTATEALNKGYYMEEESIAE